MQTHMCTHMHAHAKKRLWMNIHQTFNNKCEGAIRKGMAEKGTSTFSTLYF